MIPYGIFFLSDVRKANHFDFIFSFQCFDFPFWCDVRNTSFFSVIRFFKNLINHENLDHYRLTALWSETLPLEVCVSVGGERGRSRCWCWTWPASSWRRAGQGLPGWCLASRTLATCQLASPTAREEHLNRCRFLKSFTTSFNGWERRTFDEISPKRWHLVFLWRPEAG